MNSDSYQHCFYDYDCGEDFYLSATPSEDIWKKFELVPPSWDLGPAAGDPAHGFGPLEPWQVGCAGDETESQGYLKTWDANYATLIRSDCMWSSFSAQEPLEKVAGDLLTVGAPSGNSPLEGAPSGNSPMERATFDYTPELEADRLALTSPCLLGEAKIEACSKFESPSDSDSEGEEIDVTVKRQSLSMRKLVTIAVHADSPDPCMNLFHISVHQQQHNYAAPFPPGCCSQEGTPERVLPKEALERDAPGGNDDKEDGEIVSLPPVESEAARSCQLKPVRYYTEEATKKKSRSFLERKRRNDQRTLFFALSKEIPALASCSRVSKIMILVKAAEYLQELIGAEERMATEKRLLKRQQRQLQKRIEYLTDRKA
ncbi:putative myc-like protein MYCLP1 [Saimiri boliviensis]|uniref:putative myc-like protein MYCLP1 n=1 Tax=Saimiri boliviensis TaxID=27679 RepID=UPI000533D835|nr:putative myc-like protein MYCLP1 [Saimiri boliviensis boliviensis]